MMDAFNPSDFDAERHESLNRVATKGHILSLVAAYAHDIAYSYDYVQQYVARMNGRGSGYVENLSGQIESPSRFEFLEALEFREREIERCITDNTAQWDWPPEWGAEWGSSVASCLAADNGTFSPMGHGFVHDVRPDKLIVHLELTKQAVAVQKALLGHHQSIPLNWYTRELLSRLMDIFSMTDLFAGFPRIIEIVWSFDLAPSLRRAKSQDNCRPYAIDVVLGDYYTPGGGRESLVRVRKRAVDICASELALDASHLLNIIVIHELSHWFVHVWAHRGLTHDEEMNEWYKSTGTDVHETWAQLLTFLVCSGDEGVTKTFEKLLQHQPHEYNLWKKVHDACGKDTVRLMRSLCRMRQDKRKVSVSGWLKAL